jgi:xylulokinase
MPTPERQVILAIDLGTSGPKVALATTGGQVIGYEFEKTELILLPNGGAEQSPADWWRAIKTAAHRLLARKLAPVDAIVAICCTTQWSGTVAVDRAGEPLMNAIIWLDTRGAPYVKPVAGGQPEIGGYNAWKLFHWIRLTGGIPGFAGKDPIAHILYLKHERPEIYANTFKFLEPKDHINQRLTGQFAASYDSIALHWLTDNRDIRRVVYHDWLVKQSTVDRDKLPELRQAVDILGPIRPGVAAELGVPRDIPVVMGTPDVQSAAVGSGAVRDFEAHLYVGTSSWLACHVPFKKTDVFHGIAALPSAIPGRYLVSNDQETAGACLTFLRDNILYHQDELLAEADVPDIYKVLDRIVERTPAGSDRLIFTPWLYGERTPVDDHTIRGGLYNLSLHTTREHILRAIFEGVAYNSRWLLGYVEKFIKRRLDPIHIIGGGAQSDAWCQVYADVLNRAVRQVRDPILANVRGAAFLAAVALGYMSFDDIPERVQIAHTYTPNPDNRRIYDELFREFVGIYKTNKKMYARLNKQT